MSEDILHSSWKTGSSLYLLTGMIRVWEKLMYPAMEMPFSRSMFLSDGLEQDTGWPP